MTSQRLIVGPAALDVVARVGPASWVVLERLALNARVEGEAVVAEASVRSLAAELGWAKDTVAHALAGLRSERLVEFASARFQPGAYRLALPVDALRLEIPAGAPLACPVTVTGRRARSCRCSTRPESGVLTMTSLPNRRVSYRQVPASGMG